MLFFCEVMVGNKIESILDEKFNKILKNVIIIYLMRNDFFINLTFYQIIYSLLVGSDASSEATHKCHTITGDVFRMDIQ